MWTPAGIVINTKQNTYHPIFFRMNPAPSWFSGDPTVRFKSSMHLTEGFKTLAEANAEIARMKADSKYDIHLPGLYNVGIQWEWNGEGVPAIVWEFPFMKPKPIELEPWTPEWIEKYKDDLAKYYGINK